MSTQLSIIILYLAVTIVIGILARKRSSSSKSFHGAGLGVIMCVAISTGEWLGGTSTTGIAEYGYNYGVSGAWFTIANGIGIIVFALFFARLYRSLETLTVPGIIERYINVNARIISSILLTFIMIVVGTAQIIAAGSLGVTVLGMNYITSVLLFGLGFIVYTLAGGMVAIGYTSILHLITMYGGVILTLLLVNNDIGGIGVMKKVLPATPFFHWIGIGKTQVSSWIIASVLGACTAQASIQPILAAKDVNVAQKSSLITAFFVAPFGVLTALLGIAARIKFPNLPDAKLALPTLMMNLNPLAGGIILASVLAAILSTISPVILGAGTMITKDIYQRILRPKATERQLLIVSKVITGLAGVICIGLAILFYKSTMILDLMYFAYTLRGALFIILFLGIYWRRTSPIGAIGAMIATSLVGFFWVSYKAEFGYFPIHANFTQTYAAIITALFCTIVLSLICPDKVGNPNSIAGGKEN